MPDVQADAPGRVNLIGEHTDYHDGYVMPCAVPQRTYVTLTRRVDDIVRARSDEMPDACSYRLGHEQRTRGWGDYVQGLTWVLARSGFAITGFDLHLRSDVPVGSGLSSSAALEVAVLRALREAYGLGISDVDLARLAQRSEVEFVGAPVGIMDQMAASLAGERAALFLDTRTLQYEQILLPAGLELVVINSGVTHQHAGGGYVTRRNESENAARLLGVTHLRDCGDDALATLEALPPLLARRARHVITENARVLAARTALRDGDLIELGRLFSASHVSLRDDYEVSVPAVDRLVELAEKGPDVFGARMTGGGFGGAIVVAARSGAGADVGRRVTSAFASAGDGRAVVLVPLS